VSRYTADSRDRVLAAVDMVALISPRSDLRRAGVDSYFGLCPFHDERSPSFHVRPDAKHYHCFGCQESGDPFDFVMQTEGLDFKAAMESLADRFGVQLETEDEDPGAAARRQRRERLHSLLDRVTTYYARYLWEAGEAQDAREYLLGRGLSEETLKEFRVGYAPSAWDRVLLASRRAGYSDDELLATGLAQRSRARPGSIYDRFRGRVMFPAADARGRVHGFGARRMREEAEAVGPSAKYLNTSDGELYHKREVLFGIDLARAPAAKAGHMILVEGYTDVLALHQAGIRNAVGIMGTSLTEEQIRELERVVKVLELCLDADRAGQEAMLRAAKLAAGRQVELRVIPLPEGTDPADLVLRDGAEAVQAQMQNSVPFVSFNVDHILGRADTRTVEGKDRALMELRPMIQELGGSVLHDDLLRRIASRLELGPAQVGQLATTLSKPGGSSANGKQDDSRRVGGTSVSPIIRAERLFLALCVAVPDLGEQALKEIEVDELLTSGLLQRAARHLANSARTPLADLPTDDEELARTISGLVAQAGRVPDPSRDRLSYARLLLDRDRLDRAISRARERGQGTSELARERELVRTALHDTLTRIEKTL
jgi:DNA primase